MRIGCFFIMLVLLTNQQNGVIILLTRQQNVLRREVKCLYLDHKMKGKLKKSIDKHALLFGLISVFLCGIGFSIIMPVVPFLVQPYTSNPEEQALVVTLLTSVYAACVFLAAPVLGDLSDKYGSRPLLLICLFGSAIGYLVFGIGGALWVLFAGRIIEGITGGSISTIFAYFADIIPKEQRTKYFGWVSAVVGAGTIIGPTIGGITCQVW